MKNNARAQERAELWLRRARLDHAALTKLVTPVAPSAKNRTRRPPDDPALGVYLLQQCIEKAAKALLVASGEREDRFGGRRGHRSLALFLDYMRKPLGMPIFVEALGTLVETSSLKMPSIPEAQESIVRLFGQSGGNSGEADRQFLRELAGLPPEVVQQLVVMMDEIRRQFLKKARYHLPANTSLRVDPAAVVDGAVETWLVQIAKQFVRHDPLTPEQLNAAARITKLALDAASPDSAAELRNMGTQIVGLKRDRFVADSILPLWAQLALYLLAALTFPHESSTRYPAPVGAPSDPRHAAAVGKLGFEHYTKDLGVVALLPELVYLSKLMLGDIGPAVEGAASSGKWRLC